jgi:hypothetical protein
MQSDLYQVVGILKGDRLTLYVDRSEDNAPVTGATVSVTVEGEAVPAVANADGTYAVSSPHLAEPGSNDLVIQVAGRAVRRPKQRRRIRMPACRSWLT